MLSKKLLSGAALTALSLSMAGAAHAQSTASQIQDEETTIVVTGARRSVDGAIVAETAPKARSTITEEYIGTQSPGQSILSTINLVPGVNFTNNDAFGSSGGNLRMRGFDGSRVLVTFDGIPLNDTGNYAIFSNQMLDPELISRAVVNLGTTDVDSPTAAVTGGTINYVTRVPEDEAGLMFDVAGGSENYRRVFALAETGAFGPWGTSAWASGSYQNYDQFVGPGELEKYQFNARLYQPVGENGDFMSLAFHWNRNRNNFYRTGNDAAWAGAGGKLANIDTCVLDAPTAGVADNDGSGSSSNNADPASCTNYYNLRINPSHTGNIRGQSRFSLGESLTFTLDPTVQYVLANGGGTTVVAETDNRLDHSGTNATGPGVDLNFDGDVLDSVRLYSPSNTNTIRYTLSSSLIWDLNDTNRLIFGYTYDTGRHRQTGEYGYLEANGDPESVWGGKDEQGGNQIFDIDGDVFQKRDRLSIATLSQPSVRYVGDFADDTITLDVGVRAPTFTRELDQRCWAALGSTNDPTCGFDPGGTAVDPFETEVEWDDVLANIGVSFRPGEGHQFYASYAETISAPRTDDLYSGIDPADLQDSVVPETAQTFDVGYRFQAGSLILSSGAFYSQFENRIVRSYDDVLDINIARNVGAVDIWGAEAQAGYQFTDAFSLYGSAAYLDSEVQDDLETSPGVFAPTGGKQLVETPDWTFALRGEYEGGPFTLGGQARYVGERWRTDVNDLAAGAYTVIDFDVNWEFAESTALQFNLLNAFDESYQGSLSTATTGTPNYMIGSPRTVLLSVRTEF
ncbi:TonB-dependent receptor domain-containing protein [Terricaulis silvestris]|uniref:Catecholate siderophore receptor CirA n=1 Tax=Terricaulis silvestris TaxID=2686094 RepID=A0A6I6MHE0_9CAUL|nr:TonB-dependent receptor [Terricaulis silvestris]QGZ94285.1 catecholate siderophore receptor CirA [Terricaulis silvestris]